VEIAEGLAGFRQLSTPTTAFVPTPLETPSNTLETSTPDIEGTFIDTVQFHLPEPLTDDDERILAVHGLFPKEHKDCGLEIFLYLNNSPKASAISRITSVSLLLQELSITFSRTADKSFDLAMTATDFNSGRFFPGFDWNRRDRQWEYTDSNGIMTRIYDKTAEIFRRGMDTPTWLKGKLNNHDRGVSHTLHTVRFEARHTKLSTLSSTPLHVPLETISYTTPQTLSSSVIESVQFISLVIRSKASRCLDGLVTDIFKSLQSYFPALVGKTADNRFSEIKAQLKKLHPDISKEIAKIRRQK
jgi:hypothetical protein